MFYKYGISDNLARGYYISDEPILLIGLRDGWNGMGATMLGLRHRHNLIRLRPQPG